MIYLSDDEVQIGSDDYDIGPCGRCKGIGCDMCLMFEEPMTNLKRNNAMKVEISDVEDGVSEDDIIEASEIMIVNNKRKKAEQAQPKDGKKKPRVRGALLKKWAVTYNKPKVDEEELAERLKNSGKVAGFAFQKEKGANGTEHYQMYVELKNQSRMDGVKEIIGDDTIHCEGAKATRAQNVNYCTKAESREGEPVVWGTCNEKGGQGERTDLKKFGEAVINARGLTNEIINEHVGAAIKYGKHACNLVTFMNYNDAKKEAHAKVVARKMAREEGRRIEGIKPRELVLMFGPTAVGKTTLAEEMALDYDEDNLAYKKHGNNKWWDNYQGEKAVIVDEWKIGFASFEEFNALTNEGIALCETKGGHVTMQAKAMLFTSNRHPMHIFECKKNEPRYRALARRFAKVYWWMDGQGPDDATVLENPGPEPEDEEGKNAWAVKMAPWKKFWDWKDVPIVEGNEYTPGQEQYFTL